MKKRIELLGLSFAVTMSILVNSMTVKASQYPDVNENNWYYPYVMDVSDRGIMTGYGNGKFGAVDKMTRGQFATILWRMSGAPDVGYDGRYPDVSGSVFYATASKWASETGVITGYNSGKFGGSDNISREQVATILHRYTGGEANGDIWAFPDGAKVSQFARDGMSYAVGNNIIKGDNGYLNPQGSVSRAVAATMMSRLSINNSGNTDNNNNGSSENTDNNGGNSGNTDNNDHDVGELTKRNELLRAGLTYCDGSRYPVVAPDAGIDWDNDIYQVHSWVSKNTDVTVFSHFSSWEGDLNGVEPPDEWGSPYWSWCLNGQGLSLREWLDTYLEPEYSYMLHDPYVRDSHIRLGIDGEYNDSNGNPVHYEPGENPFILDKEVSAEEVANRQLNRGSGYPSVTLSDVTNPPVEGAVLVRVFEDGYVEEFKGGFLISYDIYGGTGQWANSFAENLPDSHGEIHYSGSYLYWTVE